MLNFGASKPRVKGGPDPRDPPGSAPEYGLNQDERSSACPPKSINNYVHINTITPIMKIDMHKLLRTGHEDGRTILLVFFEPHDFSCFCGDLWSYLYHCLSPRKNKSMKKTAFINRCTCLQE